MFANPLRGSRIFVIMWFAVFLGSCTYVQTYDARITSFAYTLTAAADEKCTAFSRSLHLGHHRPKLPNVNLKSLSDEDILDILITHAEKTKDYLDKDELYLQIDIMNYNKRCGLKDDSVFQK